MKLDGSAKYGCAAATAKQTASAITKKPVHENTY